MAKIQNETAYKAAMARIEELLPLVNDDTPLDDRNLIELDLLSARQKVMLKLKNLPLQVWSRLFHPSH